MPKLNQVLVIDDDEINNFVTVNLIRNQNLAHNIPVCLTAESALELINQQLETKQVLPDLIILDINLIPSQKCNLLAALRDVKGKIPIVVILTTYCHYQDLEKLKDFPEIEEYFNKPFTQDCLAYLSEKYFSTAQLEAAL